MPVSVGSLCTGYGGLELALALAGMDIELAWVAEKDSAACAVLDLRHPDSLNLGDITTADWEGAKRTEIITAGYPCQPFSTAGKRKGSEDDRYLWPYVEKAIRSLRPGIVFLENVPGHRSKGFGTVLGDLAALGYVGSWISLQARRIGAPHKRDRVFILAWEDGGLPRISLRPFDPPFPQSLNIDRPLLPTPTAHLGESHGVSPAVAAIRRERTTGINLDDWAALFPRHHSLPNSLIWGPAVKRWAAMMGWLPTEIRVNNRGTGVRPSSDLVEWMMGLPKGWVTEVPGLSLSDQLKILGNGVVPLQGAFAFRAMYDNALASLPWMS